MIKLVIIFGILIIAIFLKQKEKVELTNTGKIKERSNHFMRQEHTFSTNIQTLQELYSVLDLEAIRSRNVEMFSLEDNRGIQFKYSQGKHEFIAYLVYEENGKITFFVDKTRNDINPNDLNVILTAIEKAIYSLDENTTVKRELIDYKHKTKLF